MEIWHFHLCSIKCDHFLQCNINCCHCWNKVWNTIQSLLYSLLLSVFEIIFDLCARCSCEFKFFMHRIYWLWIQPHHDSVVSFIIQDRDPFRNPARSMLKTMVMTAGEYEFDTIFFATQLDFATVSYIIWIVFVILMPILLANLLVRGGAMVIDPICK